MADPIDRAAALNCFHGWVDRYGDVHTADEMPEYRAIEELPSVEPERKKGKWVEKEDPYGFFDSIPVCSECGCTTKLRERYNFCPSCGADMRGEQNE